MNGSGQTLTYLQLFIGDYFLTDGCLRQVDLTLTEGIARNLISFTDAS